MKFLHTGDFHLGRSLFTMDPGLARLRREELWQALEGQVKFCLEQKIDYFLIAGDLFDKERPGPGDVDRFLNSIKGLPHVLVLKGNHDYRLSLPKRDNLYLFQGTESFDFPEDKLRIHGQSWTGPLAPKLEDLSRLEVLEEGQNICLLHGDFKPGDFRGNAFLQKMDYIGLGHIHKPQKLAERIYYPGSPEPLDPSDLGRRGYILGDLDRGKFDFIAANARSYQRIEIEERVDLARDILDRTSLNKEDFYQIILKGPTDPDLRVDLLEDHFTDLGYHVKIENRGLDLKKIQDYRGRQDVFSDLLKEVEEGVEAKDLSPLYLREVLSIYRESLDE